MKRNEKLKVQRGRIDKLRSLKESKIKSVQYKVIEGNFEELSEIRK